MELITDMDTTPAVIELAREYARQLAVHDVNTHPVADGTPEGDAADDAPYEWTGAHTEALVRYLSDRGYDVRDVHGLVGYAAPAYGAEAIALGMDHARAGRE